MHEHEDLHFDYPPLDLPEVVDAGRIPEKGELDLEDKSLPEWLRTEATDTALAHWREILEGINDYAVFASTAMYLYGKERNVNGFAVPPGDLDVAVMNEPTLERIRKRLGRVPGVEWGNDGAYRHFAGEDGKVLSGTLRFAKAINGVERVIRQPFEFYYKSCIADDKALRHRDTLRGIRVLNLEGLQQQYGNNLRFEVRKKRAADAIVADLSTAQGAVLSDELVQWKLYDGELPFVPSAELTETLQRLSLTPDELREVFRVMATRDHVAPEVFERAITKLLSGQKTKTGKREKNLHELQDAQRIDLGGQQQ